MIVDRRTSAGHRRHQKADGRDQDAVHRDGGDFLVDRATRPRAHRYFAEKVTWNALVVPVFFASWIGRSTPFTASIAPITCA